MDQVDLAWRLQEAIKDDKVTANDVADQVANIAFSQRLQELSARGIDLVNNVYQAATSKETGELLFDHEDYVHKLKNMIAQVCIYICVSEIYRYHSTT